MVTDPINPPQRLLMGPGPINADPRVLRAMSSPLVGQYDPAMTTYMNETMELYRGVFRTANDATLIVDGTGRAGIEAVFVSLIEPGDVVLVPVFGRFGLLLRDIALRCQADVRTIEREWGTVFTPAEIEAALIEHRPKLLAIVHGDTSTTVAQPLDEIGALAEAHGALFYTDSTASLGGNTVEADAWGLDAITSGLQKCLAGPSGSSPITLSDRAVAAIAGRATPILSNYFDLGQILDYWGPKRLNHHTEATSMLYAAHECARLLVDEGLPQAVERHRLHGTAMVTGLGAMGLDFFGDQSVRMNNIVGVRIPDGVDGEAVRATLLADFGIEIGTSFGPMAGRVWRIGTMGYNARRDAVLSTLAALELVLRRAGVPITAGSGAGAALDFYG